MLEFLKGKKNHFVGIDFGTSSIKVVELSYENQKAKLENYGIVDLNWEGQEEKQPALNKSSYEKRLNDALQGLIVKMKLKNNSNTNTYVSIPGFSGLITIIELPEMEKEELARAIQFEAHKYIPSSLDEVAMSWEVIEHIESGKTLAQNLGKQGGKKIRVLLVAAPKKDIEHYDRLVSGVNCKVVAIELETFSIARSLVGEDNGSFFVIDIGSRATNMFLIEKGVVIMNRNIDSGGSEITMAISDSMNISWQRADVFKKGDKELINSKESALIVPVLELIANESRRMLNVCKDKNKDFRIDGVLLSGGTSKMKGLEQYFTRCLGYAVTMGNPWRRISYDDNAKPLIAKLGASFSVALGLALRGIEEYKRE